MPLLLLREEIHPDYRIDAEDTEEVHFRDKLAALVDIVQFDPRLTVFLLVLGIFAAAFESVGLGFILPIIEVVQTENPQSSTDGALRLFVTLYQTLSVPFTLEYVVIGESLVMTARYVVSFLVAWLRAALRTYYTRDMQVRAYEESMSARVAYFDREGSDDMLNAIVTQTFYGGQVISRVVDLVEQSSMVVGYLLIAFWIAPKITAGSVVVLGLIALALRAGFDPGYDIGSVVADANEQRQEAAQAGTQGIRAVKLFGIGDELCEDFYDAVDDYTEAWIRLRRNESAISKFYNLAVAVSVFLLIFVALEFADLSFGSLGVFLFAMFRLGSKVSTVNRLLYNAENDLPNLVRTKKFLEELEENRDPAGDDKSVPDEIDHIEFDDVEFSYDGEEQVLRRLSFEMNRSEFIAFAGQSGAGKSTIVSLLAQPYEADSGEIRANGVPMGEMNTKEWREQVAVIQQNPYILNDTLRYNLTLANRDVSEDRLRDVCSIARIDELPDSLETNLGDKGVRPSGGQKQRVALARALLRNAEILVLDEATSDPDTNLEREVQARIEEAEKDRTTIAIAHRLSTIVNADRIYTVDDGETIESETHEQLMGSKGQYADLCTVQKSG